MDETNGKQIMRMRKRFLCLDCKSGNGWFYFFDYTKNCQAEERTQQKKPNRIKQDTVEVR